jgi:hypothetical protein
MFAHRIAARAETFTTEQQLNLLRRQAPQRYHAALAVSQLAVEETMNAPHHLTCDCQVCRNVKHQREVQTEAERRSIFRAVTR